MSFQADRIAAMSEMCSANDHAINQAIPLILPANTLAYLDPDLFTRCISLLCQQDLMAKIACLSVKIELTAM